VITWEGPRGIAPIPARAGPADHASVRKAAKALGISQPASTKGLFRIEKEVGKRLFDGHGQAIAPTVFGAIVVDAARKVLDPQEAMTRAINRAVALRSGLGRATAGRMFSSRLRRVSGNRKSFSPNQHLAGAVAQLDDLGAGHVEDHARRRGVVAPLDLRLRHARGRDAHAGQEREADQDRVECFRHGGLSTSATRHHRCGACLVLASPKMIAAVRGQDGRAIRGSRSVRALE
jgi:hypothetical protein